MLQLLTAPPGQRPRANVAELSTWYNGLDEGMQGQIREAVALSVEQTVFGMLAALDGARTLGDNVELVLADSDGQELTADHDLHDAFRWFLDNQSESGSQ